MRDNDPDAYPHVEVNTNLVTDCLQRHLPELAGTRKHADVFWGTLTRNVLSTAAKNGGVLEVAIAVRTALWAGHVFDPVFDHNAAEAKALAVALEVRRVFTGHKCRDGLKDTL